MSDKKTKSSPTKDTEDKPKALADTVADKPVQSQEIIQLEKKCQEYLQGWQRAKADYQNLQKDTAKERQSFARFAKQQNVEQLLPLYNNFQLAFGNLPAKLQDNEWVQGILHIKDQFSSLLKEMNIEKIKTKNQKFNASLHEAVAQENSSDKESGLILREVAPGYTVDGEVLLPAKVVVSE